MPTYASLNNQNQLPLRRVPWFTWLLALLAIAFVVLTLLGFLISLGVV
jgi:quinol-cytochrome oxidoreductase complex cytochrome b subunit